MAKGKKALKKREPKFKLGSRVWVDIKYLGADDGDGEFMDGVVTKICGKKAEVDCDGMEALVPLKDLMFSPYAF